MPSTVCFAETMVFYSIKLFQTIDQLNKRFMRFFLKQQHQLLAPLVRYLFYAAWSLTTTTDYEQ